MPRCVTPGCAGTRVAAEPMEEASPETVFQTVTCQCGQRYNDTYRLAAVWLLDPQGYEVANVLLREPGG
jgi:hypothetical protein